MKKIISVLLSISLIFSVCAVAFAVSATDSNFVQADSVEEAAQTLALSDETYPLIICPGINHSPVYLCDENNEIIFDENGGTTNGTLLMVNTDNMVPLILQYVAVPLILMLLTQEDCGLSKGVKVLVDELLSLQKTTPDGKLVNNLQLKDFHFPLSEFDENSFDGEYDRDWFYRQLPIQSYTDIAGEDEVYLYTFNLFGNVMESARGLDEFIDFVMEETGSDKVNLLNVSLGGTVFTAYMDQFDASEKVNEIVSVVAVHDGTRILEDFYEREWNLSDEAIYKELFPYIMSVEGDSAALGYLINVLLRILPRAELELLLTTAYDVIFENFLHNTSQFWAMLPSDAYPALADKYLADEEHAELRKSTDAFYHAQLNLEDNIKKFMDKGGQFNTLCGYGLFFGEQEYSFFATVACYDEVNGDGIIQLDSTSLGATAALPGEKLEGANSKYLSPDGEVDASTCAFPDNTWFFENQHHEIGGNDVALRLAVELLLDDTLVDVHSNPSRWPQYNGTRNTKWVKRSYLPDAAEIDRSTLTAEQIAVLDEALAETEEMMNRTIIDVEADEATVRKLENALVFCGVYEAEEDTSTQDAILNALARAASDAAYLIFGPQGFFD